jgi:hypothetical protein
MKTAAAASAGPLPAFPDSNKIRRAALASRRKSNRVPATNIRKAGRILRSVALRVVAARNHDDRIHSCIHTHIIKFNEFNKYLI